MNHDSVLISSTDGPNPMDKLLAKLSEQTAALTKQSEALKSVDDSVAYSRTIEYVSAASNSVPITPAADSFNNTLVNNSTAPTTTTPSLSGDDAPQQSTDELLRLKLELEAAKGKIARMDQELAQTRITKHTIDQAIGTPSELDFPVGHQADVGSLSHLQLINNSARPHTHRDNSWADQDGSRSDTSDTLSAGGFNRARAIWGNGGKQQGPMSGFQPSEALAASQWMNRGFGQPFVEAPMQYPNSAINGYPGDRIMQDPDLLMAAPAPRRNHSGGRFNGRAVGSFPYTNSNSSFDAYTPNSTPYGSSGGIMGGISGIGAPVNMGMTGGIPNHVSTGMYSGYQPQPIGTPLSPHAPEFTSSGAEWKNDVSTPKAHPTTKSLTSHRLLPPRLRHICRPPSRSTTVVCSTAQSIATGSILLTKSSVTMINKLQSSSSKSSKLEQRNRSMTSWRQLWLKPIH